ncbi:UNVERIFIED_CONTAM: Piriformospora indica-insensitive protein 2 [Sesamum radiatum]|uniref:Piriformospora indica-insensitive protein 2 n=1 Tax=Sesamum radiatum TaxID=300843 RepID=A0AAW2TX38_SESRA
MKKIKSLSFSILFVSVVYLSVWCSGEDESVAAPMKRTEVESLYSAVQAFVGKWWNGSDLYPDPCGWTPIQGVSCDLFDGFWYVTELRFGPLHDNSLSCAQNAEFSPHLFALRRLKALSFFSCFVSPHRHPVSIPTQNWEVLAASLESLEFRSNSGLTGRIPPTFGELKNLRSLVLLENGLTGEVQANLGNLINLRRLNLAGNSFTGRIPENFGGLNSLLILDMSRNSLSGSLPLSFGGLNSLLKLDLSYNKLEGKIPEELGNLKKLTLLDLSNNRGYPPKLASLPNVSALYLHGNNLTGEIKFSEWFYGKLGRRFGAWDNPNLCYPIGLMPTSYAPFGVKLCQQEIMKYQTHLDSMLGNGNGNWDHIDSKPMVSLGFSVCGVSG